MAGPVGLSGTPGVGYRILVVQRLVFEGIWRFPEIGVPPNHPIIDGFSIINHPAMGIPHDYGNPHLVDGFFSDSSSVKSRVLLAPPLEVVPGLATGSRPSWDGECAECHLQDGNSPTETQTELS